MVKLSEQLTIVIPSKDERWNILDLIELITEQRGIEGTHIVVADSSENSFSQYILKNFTKRFANKVKIDIINGGFPAEARLAGSRLVKTPYILFLDADLRLLDRDLFQNIFDNKVLTPNTHLLTANIVTHKDYNLYYDFFNIAQKISVWLGTPFAVGCFQLWRTDEYWKRGGFVPTQKFAEDYWLSKQVKPKNFKVYETNKVWTYPRRFKKKSKWYILKMMWQSYLNRNNPEFFDKDHSYWK